MKEEENNNVIHHTNTRAQKKKKKKKSSLDRIALLDHQHVSSSTRKSENDEDISSKEERYDQGKHSDVTLLMDGGGDDDDNNGDMGPPSSKKIELVKKEIFRGDTRVSPGEFYRLKALTHDLNKIKKKQSVRPASSEEGKEYKKKAHTWLYSMLSANSRKPQARYFKNAITVAICLTTASFIFSTEPSFGSWRYEKYIYIYRSFLFFVSLLTHIYIQQSGIQLNRSCVIFAVPCRALSSCLCNHRISKEEISQSSIVGTSTIHA